MSLVEPPKPDTGITGVDAEPPKRRSWKGPLVRMSVFYMLFCLGLYLFQYRLLYMPNRMDLPEVREKARVMDLTLWAEDGPDFQGFLAEPEGEEPVGTLVVFHGNAGDAIDRDFLVPLFRAQGMRVFLLEYPGYGGRPGKVGEESIVADGVSSLDKIAAEFGGPLYIIGESLGAGVVAAVLAESKVRVDGVALVTPWDTLPDLAAQRFWFVPARWIVADEYDSIDNLRSVNAPIAVYTAEKDEIIPAVRSERLHAEIKQAKRLVVLPNCGHNTWPLRFGRAEATELVGWWRESGAHRSG